MQNHDYLSVILKSFVMKTIRTYTHIVLMNPGQKVPGHEVPGHKVPKLVNIGHYVRGLFDRIPVLIYTLTFKVHFELPKKPNKLFMIKTLTLPFNDTLINYCANCRNN